MSDEILMALALVHTLGMEYIDSRTTLGEWLEIAQAFDLLRAEVASAINMPPPRVSPFDAACVLRMVGL